jgi:hypothetical protein
LLGAYVVAATGVSVREAYVARDPRLAVLLPFVFLNLHLLYGIGSLVGVVRLAVPSKAAVSGE